MSDDRMSALRIRRKSYKVSQKALADKAGITRTYLADLESGRSPLTDAMYEKLESALEFLNPDSGMYILIDYVRIRFKTTDAVRVIEDILQLKMDAMLHEEFAWYGYQAHYQYQTINVMYANGEDMKSYGVLLEMKGQGSRLFEGILEAQGRTWFDFFQSCKAAGCVFKRIDLAINDVYGILDVHELADQCRREECISRYMKKFKMYGCGTLAYKDEKMGMGYTLYIGSTSSDIYFCVYEKDYEQYIKNGVPIDENPIKNRFEIRVANDRAEHAVEDLLECRDAEHTSFGIINRYICFVKREDDKPEDQWDATDRWAHFLGENRHEIRLTTKPEPYSLRRTLNWLSHQVAPTWKQMQMLDEIMGTSIMEDMMDHVELNQRHQRLLEQCQKKIEEVILRS